MGYSVKEIFFTLQGEGANTGRPAVFCRFSGCNLWSGLERDRENAACYFCDTDFVGMDGERGGRYNSAEELSACIVNIWQTALSAGEIQPQWRSKPFVVFTGGEPALQLDNQVLTLLRQCGFQTAIETNGTLSLPSPLDWITVSPKPNSTLVIRRGDEMKLVFPHEVNPESVQELEFQHFFLSPMDTKDPVSYASHLSQARAYQERFPKWRISLQFHKCWGIP